MTTDEAYEKAMLIDSLRDELVAAFPCEECGGDGGDDGRRMRYTSVYPEPCTTCWGRGWSIPCDDEEDE